MTEYLYATDGGAYGCLIPRGADFEVNGDHISFHREDDRADMNVNAGRDDYDGGLYWNETEILTEGEAEERDLIETEGGFVEIAREEMDSWCGDVVAPGESDFVYAHENDAVLERDGIDYINNIAARKIRVSDKVGFGTSGYDEETDTFYVGLVDTR